MVRCESCGRYITDENRYSYKTSIFSSFLRSTDLLDFAQDEKNKQTMSHILGGAQVTNFERGNDEKCIAYDILEHYYKQPPLEKSVSYNYYKKNQGTKRTFVTYYTMLGVSQIKKDNFKNFMKFVQIFKDKNKRVELMIGVDNLFDDISKELGVLVYPVFLDICNDLDDIGEEINIFHDYISSKWMPSIQNTLKYSINEG